MEDILDDYTLFLHRGGGAFLRRYREAKGWNRQQLAGPRKGQPDKYSLLGKRTKDPQSEVLLPSGGKPWFRFSIYASHVRYGNFSPAKRKKLVCKPRYVAAQTGFRYGIILFQLF